MCPETLDCKANSPSLLRPNVSWGVSTLAFKNTNYFYLMWTPKILHPWLSHVLSPISWSFTQCLCRSVLSQRLKMTLLHFSKPFSLCGSLDSHILPPKFIPLQSSRAFISTSLTPFDYLALFVFPIPVLCLQSLSCDNGMTTSCASSLRDHHPVLPEVQCLKTLMTYFFFWLLVMDYSYHSYFFMGLRRCLWLHSQQTSRCVTTLSI